MPPKNNGEHHPDEFWQNLYTETRKFYEELQPELGDNDFGFKILNGPPHSQPTAFFISYQPGGGHEAREQCLPSQETWPKQLEHTHEEWRLSREIRRIFGPFPEMLESCVALNAIFFRAPNVQKWKKALPEEKRRHEAESFCVQRVLQILQAVKPKFVLINGLGTLKLLDTKWQHWQEELSSKTGATLVRRGVLANFPSMTVNHLCTYPYTRDKRQDAYSLIRKEIHLHNLITPTLARTPPTLAQAHSSA